VEYNEWVHIPEVHRIQPKRLQNETGGIFVKKTLCVFLGLSLLMAVSACAPTSGTTFTPSPPPDATSAATASPVARATASPTAKATPSPTQAGPAMYSSYADLVSFDPNTGVAQFDYFEMLRGSKAVDHLVRYEGYSKADAQARVADFADSEFVKKNLSKQLRAIDVDRVPLRLMFRPDGKHVSDANPVAATAADFRAVYAHDPELLTCSYFFYIHVEKDGRVSLVEQVYWA
jgi:hypothetical protein